MSRNVKPIPGIPGPVVVCGPALPPGQFDTVMVSIAIGEEDGVISLALLAVDDYGNMRQVIGAVGVTKAIYDYLKIAINVIDRELLD